MQKIVITRTSIGSNSVSNSIVSNAQSTNINNHQKTNKMKKIVIALTALFMAFHFSSEAQTIINNIETDKRNGYQASKAKVDAKKNVELLKQKSIERHQRVDALKSEAFRASEAVKTATTDTINNKGELMEFKFNFDALNEKSSRAELIAENAADASTLNDMKDKAAEKATSDYTGFVFGGGTLTNLENASSANPNLSIGVAFTCRRNTFMLSYNPKAAVTNDTLNLQKSFLFPEISSRAFVFEYNTALGKKYTENTNNPTDTPSTDCIGCKLSRNFFVNISTGTLKDTNKHIITPFNFKVGFRFTYNIDLSGYTDTSVKKLKNLSLSFIPAFSAITVDPKDFTNYSLMFNKSGANILQTTVDAVGARFEIEIHNLHLFFDYKYIIEANSGNVFNNSYWTIGSSVNSKLFSF